MHRSSSRTGEARPPGPIDLAAARRRLARQGTLLRASLTASI